MQENEDEQRKLMEMRECNMDGWWSIEQNREQVDEEEERRVDLTLCISVIGCC